MGRDALKTEKKPVKRKRKTDPHLGCYSYPNCDIDPNGCCVLMGAEVEPYGARD